MSIDHSIDERPTIAAPDDDPYLWLEDIEGDRALGYVEAQNQRTLAAFGDAGFERDRDALAAIFDRPDNIPFVSRRGGLLYNLWKDAAHPRGLWRRATLAEFRKPQPQWDDLLDLDKLSADEGEDWALNWVTSLPPAHDRAIVSLSRGGSDAVVLREFDLTTKRFVIDGFTLPEAKGSLDWLDADTLLLTSAFGEGMATPSGYARTVRRWRRGQPIEAAEVIFAAESSQSIWVRVSVDRSVTPARVWFSEGLDFFNHHLWLGDAAGARTKLDLPTDSWTTPYGDWMAIKLRQPWTIGETTHAADVVLGIRLSAFLEGRRDFVRLFEPGPRRALQSLYWAGSRLVLAILDELRTQFEVWSPSPQGWSSSRLPGLPEIATVDVWPLDTDEAEGNGDLLAQIQDPLTPLSLQLIEGFAAPTVLKQAPRTFTAEGFVVTRHEAISVDGVSIPYTQTGPSDPTGDAPVHMHAYGGFGHTVRPGYNSALGKLWLERGGTIVEANIRGGGEFGTAWHDAGRYAGKRLAHDDFAAVAADLVRRGVTRPQRIAAEGGSNGGILITNMLVRYPERFGALFCTIPLIDMRRYTKLLAGASWIAEYGDPDKAEDWGWLQTYSAYHMAKPGQAYPPILIATTRRDDRVHPGHARKMTAKLQAMGYDAWLYEPAAGGHGYGKDNRERAAFITLGYRFLAQHVGLTMD
ncbi:prolyl oligopeptidase family serine peptidase [Bradyrhizobium ontarionense]|uniref:Prolyl oligopeptidase family serine peptidase n=1 Tax=Bradyrhizobium ontarionense TaxID=2898149 RepID=A0ABY3R6A6_9BRAD|nr:prolyl oligopeptidase family serine peptidase [Bradyrhizobium sp. A19]UFZ02855.1 prolyl oligopeptidase family serine peptidase [Bradyrhizobium sp. A19]